MHRAEVRVSYCCSLCAGRGFSDYFDHTGAHMTDECQAKLLKKSAWSLSMENVSLEWKDEVLPQTLKSDLKKRSQISSAWSRVTFNLSDMCQLFVKHSGGFTCEKGSLMLDHCCYLIARPRGIPVSCDPSKCLHALLLCLTLGRWSARPLGIVHASTLSTVWYASGHINSFCSHLRFPVSLRPPHKSWPGGCRDRLPMWKLTGPSKKAKALLRTDSLISSAVPQRTASPSSALLG